MKKPFLLIIGESGSGKTTIANILEKEYGMKQIPSYTNRPKRNQEETGHIFLLEKSIDKIKQLYPNRVAETTYNKNFYFATSEQVDKYDTYVISPDAIPMFMQNYKGKKRVFVVYVHAPTFLRIERMRRRGDPPEAIDERIRYDAIAFKGAIDDADLIIRNFVLSESIATILDYLKKKVK